MKFDYEYYRKMYFDLRNLSNEQLVDHFKNHGMWEGRIFSEEFLRVKQEKNFKKLSQVQHSLDEINNNEEYNIEEKLINIVIRTHNRPKFFSMNIQSILDQNYKNYYLYITYENEETLNYINEHISSINNVTLLKVTKTEDKIFYNNYCNIALDQIEDGYNMFLDDDDMFTHKNTLKFINKFLEEDRFLCWEYLRADKIIGPRKNQIKCGEIVSCGFCYNNKFKSKWTPTEDGDHVFAKTLIESNNLKIGKIKTILTRSISMDVINGEGLAIDYVESEYSAIKRVVSETVDEIIDNALKNVEKNTIVDI